MTTTDSPTLRLKGPADLVAAVPYLLGFHPQDSLVLIGIADTTVIAAARMDLADATPEAVAETCAILRRDTATMVAGVIITTDPHAAAALDTVLTAAADRSQLEVLDVLLVTDEGWRSLRPTSSGQLRSGALPNGSTAVEATAVYAGMIARPNRDALADLFTPDPVRPDLSRRIEQHQQAREAAQACGELRVWESDAARALAAAHQLAEHGHRPDHDTAVWFGVALRSVAVRDQLWQAVDDGRLPGTELWIDLGRRLPHPYDAAPLFLAGWHAYRAGNSLLAGIACDLARAADPDYSAAALLQEVLHAGISRHQLPRLSDQPPAPDRAN